MPTDSATAKFLYTIIKQLDLKSVHRPRPLHVLFPLAVLKHADAPR